MSNDEIDRLIEDCELRSDSLTSWEADFIDNMSYRMARDQGLTENMLATLEKIWERVT